MGKRLIALIEYDQSSLCGAASVPPFSAPSDGVVDLSNFPELWSGKDRLFLDAISGSDKNKAGPPLFAPRGLPSQSNPLTRKRILEFLDANERGIGWLTLDELRQSLAHAQVPESSLSLPTQLTLSMMSFLEGRLGRGRVRLVFAVA